MSGKRSRISLRRPEALVRVRRRHADVDDRDGRLVHRDVTEEVVGGAGLRRRPRTPSPRAGARSPRAAGRSRRRGRPCIPRRAREGVAKRREVARQVVGEELVDPLGRRGAPRAGSRRDLAAARPSSAATVSRRDEDLASVAGVRDARRAEDVDARVALVAEHGVPVWSPIRTRTRSPPGHSVSRSARCIARAASARRRRRRTPRRTRPRRRPTRRRRCARDASREAGGEGARSRPGSQPAPRAAARSSPRRPRRGT